MTVGRAALSVPAALYGNEQARDWFRPELSISSWKGARTIGQAVRLSMEPGGMLGLVRRAGPDSGAELNRAALSSPRSPPSGRGAGSGRGAPPRRHDRRHRGACSPRRRSGSRSCGLSMGGYVALEVLRQAPGRVARLALLDTSARPATPGAAPSARAADRPRRAGPIRGGPRRAVGEPRRIPTGDADAALEEVVRPDDAGDRAGGLHPPAARHHGRADSRPLLPGIEIPTLVLVGAEDAITPPELSREIAEMVEWASLVVLPSCGHLATLERPEAVTAAIHAWLAAGLA